MSMRLCAGGKGRQKSGLMLWLALLSITRSNAMVLLVFGEMLI